MNVNKSQDRSAAAAELGLELFDAPGRVDKTLFAGVSRVRIHGHITHHDTILNSIYGLCLLGLEARLGQEFLARRDIDKTCRVVSWMNIFSHCKCFLC